MMLQGLCNVNAAKNLNTGANKQNEATASFCIFLTIYFRKPEIQPGFWCLSDLHLKKWDMLYTFYVIYNLYYNIKRGVCNVLYTVYQICYI